MSRFLHVFFAGALFLVTPPFASAQDINVVSVSPAVGATDVPLATQIEIVFDDTLDVAADFDGRGPLAFFAIEPADSIDVGPAQFSVDATRVTFDVTHTADTDFVWVLTGAASHEGGRLCDPGVLSYSTGSGRGSASVRGYASISILVKGGAECAQFYFPFVALLDRAPSAEARVIAAGSVDDIAEFDMSGIRPGTYWPVMFVDADANGLIEPDFDDIGNLAGEIAAYRIDETISPLEVTASTTYDIALGLVGGSTTRGAELPGVASLTGNFPNPFRTDTEIGFTLERPTTATIEVHDVLGRRIAILEGGTWPAGEHSVPWSASGVSPGLYLVRLVGPDFVLSRPVVKQP